MQQSELPIEEIALRNDPVESEETAARAQEICAHLLIEKYLPKKSYRDLLLDDGLRDSVSRRLDGVGLQLVDTYTSDHFAVRLAPRIEADVRFDWASNTRLPRGALALLVILWAKLVLPRRVASDQERKRQVEAEVEALESGESEESVAAPEPLPRPTVARAALYAEFGHRFGKTAFTRYVGQLKNSGYISENRKGELKEGPLLDPMIDGVQMASKLRDSVLWDLLEGHDPLASEPSKNEGA